MQQQLDASVTVKSPAITISSQVSLEKPEPDSRPVSDGALESAVKPEPEWKPTTQEFLIMLSLALVSLMIALDANIIITSLGAVTNSLHGSTTGTFWIGTAYLLTCAVTMPFTAALSDIFGRSICLLCSLAIFTVGTVFCAIAQTLKMMLIGRSIQGIGGGGIIIIGLVVFTDIVPLRFRSKYYGIIQGAWALGTCLGPIIGGLFVTRTTWRWIFYIMFPFCGIGFATIPFLLTLKPREESMREKLLRVDWLGGFLFISSSTALLIAVSWGGSMFAWGSWRTILPLILGVVGLVATGFWERFGAREPFLRHSLFHCPSAFAAYAGATLQGFLLYGALYYGPLYFMAERLVSPVQTGINMITTSVSLIPASIAVGVAITRLNHFRWAIWSGWTITTISTAAICAWGVNTPTAAWAVNLLGLGLGHGLVLNSQNFATQAIALSRDEGAAAAMYAFLRSFGMALGVGVGASVFQNVFAMRLGAMGLPTDLANKAEQLIFELHKRPAGDEFRNKVLECYAGGLRGVFAMYAGVALLAGLLSLGIRHFDLNKELSTDHTLEETGLSKRLNGAV
ncbi:major facilitator superfamily transporter [Trichodelitschia bisporula]|uniref:Major facilitator superfamily transporter n=1 Tax=Trichodelitschia bisporula TaxID=703511 RepID=A0A6G1HYB0_9PEZI|nr:major facilitator superfamily transporter [Trichodelitschia bisporula]